ncbi:MAG: hypothetical protein R3B06_29575 [Kofleriaceae bacterium]
MGTRSAWMMCMVLAVVVAACRDKKDAAPAPPPPPVAVADGDAGIDAFIITVPEDTDEDKEYVPAEFKSGADRWKDTGIYVDGRFVGLLAWAELPRSLPVVWIPVKASAPKRYGTADTGWRWAKERRYRFRDLVTSLGIEPRKVKALHVYGPKFSETIVVTGKALASKAADEFYFRFAGIVSGKALPSLPAGLANGTSPDKISALMIYVDKEPPVLERNVGLVLDGEVQSGVPYFGTPLRGGVRVYKDDRLVVYIKRQDLPVAEANTSSGEPQWQLFPYLQARGVETADLAEAWVVRDEKWEERFDRAQLQGLWFGASAQAKGHIELADPNHPGQVIKAQALILRTSPLPPAEKPAPDPEEL